MSDDEKQSLGEDLYVVKSGEEIVLTSEDKLGVRDRIFLTADAWNKLVRYVDGWRDAPEHKRKAAINA